MIVRKLSLLLGLLCAANFMQGATFTVSNTSGLVTTGSFAKAIADANAAGAGPHTIVFSITNSTITSADYTLYQISNSGISIDATGRNITFSGSFTAAVTFGLSVMNTATNTSIRGLTFTNFSGACIRILATSGTKVLGCRFGTTTDGTSSVNTTMAYGVHINGASGVIIGGNTAADRNYFADASTAGLYILSTDNVMITGNYFGVNAAGTGLYTDKNGSSIFLYNCTNSTIGRNATGERNLFAGSTNLEIEITGSGGYNNTISNNYFGYNAAKTAQLTYNNGIRLTSANSNLIMFNSFGGTYANPFDASGTYVGNKLKQNSFESHSGDPNSTLMQSFVTQPLIYSVSSTILKGKAAPGDSVEIYYANSYNKSGLTFITAVKADATTGRWSYTGTFTVGQYVAVTATNNTNNTTSWFSIIGPSIYACANNPVITTTAVCNVPNLVTAGFYPNGSLGTTNPVNAGIWSSTGGGTFTNGGLYAPSITKYLPTATELASGNITLRLTTTDTNCVNGTGAVGTIPLRALPTINPSPDFFACSTAVVPGTSPSYASNSNYTQSWSCPDQPGMTFFPAAGDNPYSYPSTQGYFRLVRNITENATGCVNRDTVVMNYRTTPSGAGTTLTTTSQIPVTQTITPWTGEILTITVASISPAGTGTANVSGTNITYTSTGTFYGAAAYTFTTKNQCNVTSASLTTTVTVQNAAPVVLPTTTISSTRGERDTIVVYIPALVTDINHDLDTNSFVITSSLSGVSVAYNSPSKGYVTIFYNTPSSTDYVGTDVLNFRVADKKPTTVQGQIKIERLRNLTNPSGTPEDIVVYDAISPDGDGINDFLHIVNLSDYANTVTIYDRWGDKVWEGKDYNNTTVRFEGNRNVAAVTPLPNGTYFFVIKNESRSDNDQKAGLTSGYLVIRRQE